MLLGAGFYLVLADSLVGSLVIQLVSELLSCDIMQVIYFHQIDAQMKWISQILANIGPYGDLLNCLFKNIYRGNKFVRSFVF
jgi:hypothetical protein